MTNATPQVSDFGSVDPAPPATNGDHQVVLQDEDARMFQRMRAVFALRNDGSDQAVDRSAPPFLPPAPCCVTSWLTCLDRCKTRVLSLRSGSVWRTRMSTSWSAMKRQKPWAPSAMHALVPFCSGFSNTQRPRFRNLAKVALDLLDWCERAEWEKP